MSYGLFKPLDLLINTRKGGGGGVFAARWPLCEGSWNVMDGGPLFHITVWNRRNIPRMQIYVIYQRLIKST